MASKKRKKNPLEYRDQKRELKKAKKHNRRGKSKKKPRRRDWETFADDEFHEGGFERIMPRDEHERREKARQTVNELTPGNAAAQPATVGLVIEVASGLCRVQMPDGIYLCTLRGALLEADSPYANVIAVGDEVVISQADDQRGVVEHIRPRRNRITRPDPGLPGHLQVLAANLDQLVIVQAWRNPDIWYELIDRYLIAAERNDITPIICVNKIDLSDDVEHIKAQLAPYTALGYTVILTSAADHTGLDELRAILAGKVTAVAGLSGVGKSSLLAAVQPGFDLRTGTVNEERGQGRHTTTQATMLPLQDGYVIDTPGIREFGLSGLARPDLVAFYPEVAQAAALCKFADCTHQHEPGCGVRAELETGGISETRFHSYRMIAEDLPE